MEEIERLLESPALSDSTRRAYRSDLEQFAAWLSARELELDDVDVRVLSDYAADLGAAAAEARAGVDRAQALGRARRCSGSRSAPRGFRTRRSRRSGRGGSRRARSSRRSTRCSTRCEREGPLGLRDRALVELVYSAGLRSAEAVGLDLQDVDFEQELLHVRGKGGKERAVPLGEEAALPARAATSATAGRSSRAEPRTRSSSPPAGGGSTPAPCAGSLPTRTSSATPSRRTCSRAAPTCA